MTPDPLDELKQKRGDEMSPAMIAAVALAQFWLALLMVAGTVASIAAGLAIAFWIFGFKTTPILIGGYLATALPLTALGYTGVQMSRRKIAKALAARIEAQLDGIGGLASPVALSLRPSTCAHQRVLVDGLDVHELKRSAVSNDTRKMFMLQPTCADCGAHLTLRDLGARIDAGGDLYDARFEWRRPPQPVG